MFFGSDNQTGCSAPVLHALTTANAGFTHGYGNDDWTARAVDALRRTFDVDLDAFFVATGTAANCLAISALVRPWQTVLAHAGSHLLMDESTAPEFFSAGARVLGIGRGFPKLTPALLDEHMAIAGKNLPHNPQPAAISLSQANEAGLVYTPDEVRNVAAWARSHSLGVHMDGARFSNAVAHLGCSPADVTWKSGVDILTLGASKNGCLAAEAILVFNKEYSETILHQRKRSGHLLSKGRLLGAQISAWLAEGHWLDLAHHANRQAKVLAQKLQNVPGVSLIWPVEANELFVRMPKSMTARLRECGGEFYDWSPQAKPIDSVWSADDAFIRLVCSFATTDEHIDEFMAGLATNPAVAG